MRSALSLRESRRHDWTVGRGLVDKGARQLLLTHGGIIRNLRSNLVCSNSEWRMKIGKVKDKFSTSVYIIRPNKLSLAITAQAKPVTTSSSKSKKRDQVMESKGTVCVTGASGYVASWLIRNLLLAGYHVRGTVRDPENRRKVQHLLELEGAAERLRLVKADLMDEGSFDEAVIGCEGVFHIASPVVVSQGGDPQKEILDPSIKGTLNVLRSCAKNPSLRRFVFTSSSSAVTYKPDLNPAVPIDESSWSDVDLCTHLQAWYPVAKTLSEKAATEFAKDNGIDLVSVIPAFVVGPSVSRDLNASAGDVLGMLKGETEAFTFFGRMGYVHIDDVARCHILVYETPEACGRYICCSTTMDNNELVSVLRARYPSLPSIPKEFGPSPFGPLPPFTYNTSKLEKMGFEFRTIGEMFDDCIESLKKQGHLDL